MKLEEQFSPKLADVWKLAYQQSTINVPFYSKEWHELYSQMVSPQETPYILYNSELAVVAPFMKKNKFLSFAGPEITDYSDIIGAEDHKEVVWEEILLHAKKQGFVSVSLTNIPESSATYTYFQNKKNSSVVITQRDTTPKLPLPKTHDEYCASLNRKHRHELQRKMRKFEREFSNYSIIDSQNPARDIDMLIQLMKLDERKKTFFTPENENFFRQLPIRFPQEILIQTLFIDSVPATSILAFITNNTFLLYNSGFDQATFPGAGFYLKSKSVHYAIEKKFTEYNFLRGNERYKYELGGKDFAVYDIQISI